MPNVTFSYFAVPSEDGSPRVCAVVDGCSPPDGAVPITQAEAVVIEANVRAASVPIEPSSPDPNDGGLVARLGNIEAILAEHANNFLAIKRG